MMGLALRAARRGDPSPNPHVGAVIARGERVLGVGFHLRAGEAHAEVAAIRAARAARAPTEGATIYVTLEPCNHFGRTPPCTDAILEAGLRRVVIAASDPTDHTAHGEAKLRAAGVEVDRGLRREEAELILAPFRKQVTTGLPLVLLKAALTLDGRMATRSGDSKWITGERARAYAHRLRAWSDAILIGAGTALADDPSLTVRMAEGRDPLRVVLDTHLRTPPEAKLLGPGSGPGFLVGTLIFHGQQAREEKKGALIEAGAELVELEPGGKGGLDLRAALGELGRRGCTKLMVEGGPRIHGALLAAGLADRVALFYAPKLLGDPSALPLAFGPEVAKIAEGYRLEGAKIRRFPPDWMVEGELRREGGG